MIRRFAPWGVLLLLAASAAAQSLPGSLAADLRTMVAMPALPGYEQALATHIAAQLSAFHPRRDNLGDVLVTVGSGAPARLIAAPLDEPGYVVSGITPDGFLRLQRLPTRANLPLFNALQNAQPVAIGAANGLVRNGVIEGLSVHLQPGRVNPPDPDDIDNLYVDVGCTNAAEVRAAGIELLSPVWLNRSFAVEAGGQLQAYGVADRYGAAVLLEALRHLDSRQLTGSVTFAFLTQQWTGSRGWDRVNNELQPAPTAKLFVGGVQPAAAPGRGGRGGSAPPTRDGVENWSIPVMWPVTPAETIDGHDLAQLVTKVEAWLGETPAAPTLPSPEVLPEPPQPAAATTAPTQIQILEAMTAQYGVNPHEQRVAAAIKALLPPWARPSTDDSGNLILHWGDGSAGTQSLVFMAHQDEIGFDVAAITPDGRLQLRSRGGGDLNYYLGHPILFHSANGMHPGVTELPDGWTTPGFKLAGPRIPLVADIGASSAGEVAALGIAVGDSVTIPKRYRQLSVNRATTRAFDDRVGDTALIAAAWALGPSLPGRDVTFVWSTGEEIGELGAKAMAARLAAAGQTPAYVFAIDTFVSSDTPLESHRFADTPIGDGFIIRAVDDSSLTPMAVVHRLQALARAHQIPFQTGATGGGNDGSAFVPYGAIDVPLGWPLRISHSPGEVIDTRDLNSLTRILETLARSW